MKQRFPATIELALAAMLFSVVFGIPLGFFAAKRYGSVFDNFSLVASLIGVSIPVFFLGIILKYVFAVQFGWLPTVGRIDVLIDLEPSDQLLSHRRADRGRPGGVLGRVKHLILPAIALGSIPLAIIARITRPPCSTSRTRTTSARRARRGWRPGRSTAATSSATRCCRS